MKRKGTKTITVNGVELTIVKNAVSHANDPFFIKKAEESVKFLNKHGFPKFPQKKK